MLNMVMGLNNGWGSIWSWQAFRMVCRHTVLSRHIADVRWVVYCVTVVVGGGINVIMACWKACRLFDSLNSPHVQCINCSLVTSDPLLSMASQVSGRDCISVLIW